MFEKHLSRHSDICTGDGCLSFKNAMNPSLSPWDVSTAYVDILGLPGDASCIEVVELMLTTLSCPSATEAGILFIKLSQGATLKDATIGFTNCEAASKAQRRCFGKLLRPKEAPPGGVASRFKINCNMRKRPITTLKLPTGPGRIPALST